MLPERKTYAPFTQTGWTIVLRAKSDDSQAQVALGELCRKYWGPLYAFLRASGNSPHAAEDLVQGFFWDQLKRKKPWLQDVGPEKGRFRTYLLRCLKNYATNEYKKENAGKRKPPGGIVPFTIEEGETHYHCEPGHSESPDKIYQRQWGANLVKEAKAALRAEYHDKGKLQLYELLEPHLGARVEEGIYRKIALILGMSEGALRTELSRMKTQFRKHLRAIVADTVDDPREVTREIRDLFGAWS